MIAKSVPKGKGSGKRYERHYPMGTLFGHPIGYSFMEYGQSEFEKSHNAELTGEESEFGTILDELTGQKQEGEQVVTNLDVRRRRKWRSATSKRPASAPSWRSNRAPARSR